MIIKPIQAAGTCLDKKAKATNIGVVNQYMFDFSLRDKIKLNKAIKDKIIEW